VGKLRDSGALRAGRTCLLDRRLLGDPALAMNELVSEGLAERGFADFRTAHGTIGQHIRDEGSRLTELAQLAQVSKPTVVYLVNDLERLAYVERAPDPEEAARGGE
jgi:hypothetical protein